MVVFDGVGLRYGRGPAIFSGVSLTLTAGSFHFLVGPSGAGKSSFLRLMYLAARPAEGRMTLFGRQIGRVTRRELPALRRRIGVVFQDFRLIDHLNVVVGGERVKHDRALKAADAAEYDAEYYRGLCTGRP